MKKILVLIPLLVLISCGVQKRKYQKGFYVNWSKSKQQEKKALAANATKKTNNQSAVQSVALPPAEGEQEPAPVLEASADKSLTNLKIEKSKILIHLDEPCDVLIFNDGSEINGKVIEITATEVRYKKCDMPDGPAYVAKKSNLFMVKYANGTKEMFKEAKASTVSAEKSKKPQNNKPKIYHPMARASFILGIFSVIPFLALITGTLAIIFSNTAQREIKASPDDYTGLAKARIGKVFGFVGLGMTAYFLILILVSTLLFI